MISPVKIFPICSVVKFCTGLSLCTAIAIPSIAICFISNSSGFSLSFKSLDISPIRAIPERTEFGASPEPVPLFSTETPGYFSLNASPKAWHTLVIEVEPFNVNLPATVPLISWLSDNLVPTISGPQPVSKPTEATNIIMVSRDKNLFILV